MVNADDGYSICSHCVKVCHVDHEVVFIGCGPHFCDCGDPENKTCHVIVSEQPGMHGIWMHLNKIISTA